MSTVTTKLKPLLFASLGVLSTLGALSLAHTGPAQADNAGGLPALAARLNADEAKIAALQAAAPVPGPKGDTGPIGPQGVTGATGLQGLAGANGTPGAKGDAGATGLAGATGALGANGAVGANGPQGIAGPQGATGTNGKDGAAGIAGAQGAPGTVGARGPEGPEGVKGALGAPGVQGPAGVQGLAGPAGLSPFTISGTQGQAGALVTLSGYNLQIVNGKGRTDDGTKDDFGNPIPGKSLSGLGNLIIGYNGPGNDLGAGDVRTGSHNLILGDQNNYSSFGGLVAGADNAITNIYASVSGGAANTARGDEASVSGGRRNTAGGQFASVSGGYRLTANGGYDVPSGAWDGTGPTWAAAGYSGH